MQPKPTGIISFWGDGHPQALSCHFEETVAKKTEVLSLINFQNILKTPNLCEQQTSFCLKTQKWEGEKGWQNR